MSRTSTTESKTATGYETKSAGREGKSYAYQPPQESAQAEATVDEQKEKVMTALDDLIEAIAARTVKDAVGTGTPPTSGTVGAGTTPPATVPPTTGAPTSGSPAYTGAPPTGAPARTGGEAPTEAMKAAADKEAMETSVATQRSAYAIDRSRESTKLRRRESEAASPAAAGGAPIAGAPGKHLSDSNRAPLTEAHQFGSSFGALGKAAAPTIERVTVVAKRPENAPAAATVTGPKPIDAYYASFGTAIERAVVRAKMQYTQLESIIGTDDRVRVTNNTLYPWRCICSLLMTANTGAQYLGTGWLVAPRLVLTAGHCVYMADEGGWVTQIEVIPGRNATDRPFGSAIARDFRSVTGWTQDNDSNYDYGGILLPEDKRYGEQLGWFGYASRDDDYLKAVTLNLAGYPGDGGKTAIDGTQWYHSRTVRDVLEKQITYEIDTYGGQSGAPVWELASNGSRYGVAIHTFGTPVNNGGTRITGDVFDNIVLWAGQAP